MTAVVFDFGGVLFRWQPKVLLSKVLPHHTPDDAAAQALVADFFQSYQGDWGDFDRGLVEIPELAQRIARRTRMTEDEVHAVIAAVPAALEPMAESVALLERLHTEGAPLYFLSNMPGPMADYLVETHAFLRRFRRGVFSAHVRMAKPDRSIYDHAADHFGHAPHELLFIDDHPPNIDAAKAAGWDAVHFVDAATLEADLVSRGLLQRR